MEIQRNCQVNDHKQPISHLCVYKDCLNNFRWACQVCLENKFHHHGLQNDKHMMNLKQLITLLCQQKTSFEQIIISLRKDIYTITRQQINRIINFNNQIVQDEQIPQNKLVAKKQQSEQKKTNPNKYNQDFQYQYALQFEKEIKQSGKLFDEIWISPNEKYLLFFFHGLCSIYDLRSKQQVCSRKVKGSPQYAAFSSDSKYFFMVNFRNKVLCYRLNKKFKLVYQLFNTERYYLSQSIIFISPSIYLMRDSDKIILNNIKRNKFQNLNPTHSRKLIHEGFDYCYQQKTLIFVQQKFASIDWCEIKFMKIPSRKIIMKQKFNFSRIKIIKNNQLISAEQGTNTLCLWQINYSKKKIMNLKVFESEFPLKTFHYFKNLDQIYIYQSKTIQIINRNFEILQRINPQLEKKGNNLFIDLQIVEYQISVITPSLNYIIFYGQSKRLNYQILEYFQVYKSIEQFGE